MNSCYSKILHGPLEFTIIIIYIYIYNYIYLYTLYLGLLYRQYQFCDSKILKQMFIYLVRLHLEYAAQVWDPHLQQNIDDIERVQKFALRICSKEWEKEFSKSLKNKCTYL